MQSPKNVGDNVGAEYWKQRLLGKPPLLLLPTDRPRGSTSVGAPLYTVSCHWAFGAVQGLPCPCKDCIAQPHGGQENMHEHVLITEPVRGFACVRFVVRRLAPMQALLDASLHVWPFCLVCARMPLLHCNTALHAA